jgi:hypothetical protein
LPEEPLNESEQDRLSHQRGALPVLGYDIIKRIFAAGAAGKFRFSACSYYYTNLFSHPADMTYYTTTAGWPK